MRFESRKKAHCTRIFKTKKQEYKNLNFIDFLFFLDRSIAFLRIFYRVNDIVYELSRKRSWGIEVNHFTNF